MREGYAAGGAPIGFSPKIYDVSYDSRPLYGLRDGGAILLRMMYVVWPARRMRITVLRPAEGGKVEADARNN